MLSLFSIINHCVSDGCREFSNLDLLSPSGNPGLLNYNKLILAQGLIYSRKNRRQGELNMEIPSLKSEELLNLVEILPFPRI